MSHRMLKESQMFTFAYATLMSQVRLADANQLRRNEEHALHNLINAFEIESTPLQKYLQSY